MDAKFYSPTGAGIELFPFTFTYVKWVKNNCVFFLLQQSVFISSQWLEEWNKNNFYFYIKYFMIWISLKW